VDGAVASFVEVSPHSLHGELPCFGGVFYLKGSAMNISPESIKALFTTAEAEVKADAGKFVDYIEGKQLSLDAAKAELVEAGYTVSDPKPAEAAPVA